jgi:cytochrome c6
MNAKLLAILITLLLSIHIGVSAQHTDPQGMKIYQSKCTRCHGEKGTRGFLGARNLRLSKLNDNELYATISEGKRIMPSWKERLTPEQIHSVIRYVKSLRVTDNTNQ